MFGMLSMLWSAWVAPAKADERVTAGAFYLGMAAADLASTHYAESNGGRELNPLMRGHGTRYALKVAQVGALTWIDHELGKRDRTIQWIVRGLALAAHTWVVFHNVRIGRNLR